MEAQENQVPLPMRPHTILGVCEGLGEDFGFNPLLLRVPFAASVIFSPIGALSVYFALGLVVMVSRFLAPKRKVAAALEPAVEAPVEIANEQSQEYAKAA